MWFDPGLAGLFITSTLLHLEEDINNNQLNRNNMFILKKIRNMDEQINRASIYAQRICHNTR